MAGQLVRRVRIAEQRAVTAGFDQRRRRRDDGRAAAQHRLLRRYAEALVQRRQNEAHRALVERAEGCVRDVAQPHQVGGVLDLVGGKDTGVVAAGDGERQIAAVQPVEGFDHQTEVLVDAEAAQREHEAPAIQAVLGEHRPVGRRAQDMVGAIGNDVELLRADLAVAGKLGLGELGDGDDAPRRLGQKRDQHRIGHTELGGEVVRIGERRRVVNGDDVTRVRERPGAA